jgi:PAS domain-containing protein
MAEGSAAANSLVQTTLLGELLEHANVGAVAADGGRCVAANVRACELIGYERAELIGRPVEKLCLHYGSGTTTVGHKDGRTIDVAYRVVEATLAGMPIMLGLFWPV